ncbi:hypothetical protein COURTHOUSE_157 [Mycobacterium phage Courthouse]|uniref:Uncharacterized protein n=2 Tax=Omegavirus courthouse TaxID=1089119 RepID=G8I5L4_9CAUD|nr:hypothetical protein CM09_gp157 [Mycobacterium phage Courthouse]YP_009205290.1 hypothetical protein AVT17_gp160 [Mycobacterium phage Ariel]AER48008.1 hypothetical protein COURTHOUSE_157 [Mycobacterium phage Courthouse]AIM50037.1 hypothetical protein PBI_ARIEL_160 [Mycobacterium phage Ariel]ATS92999.1 hypothetical protein SEA_SUPERPHIKIMAN_158 [Mycobacterium phage Superphikiman]
MRVDLACAECGAECPPWLGASHKCPPQGWNLAQYQVNYLRNGRDTGPRVWPVS